MDYTINYGFIKENGNVTNMNEPYMLFYDETNNPRTFRLNDTGFNVDESEYFIVGGVGFKTLNDADTAPVDKLFHGLRLQSNATEAKFKHIQQNAKDFLSLMAKPKVRCFLDWLNGIETAFIHYSFVDNFYYAIVDIVDSTDESWFMGPDFNRELKGQLYSLIKEYKDWFIELLIEVDYPNIKNHQYFITQVVEWLWTVNISDDFHLEYLRQSLKSYRNKNLVFLEDNRDGVAIDDYSGFYANCIVTYKNAYHLFDHETKIEELLNDNSIEIDCEHLKNYSFVDSKDYRMIQISDLIVGILRMWMAFLEDKNVQQIVMALKSATSEQKEYISKLQQLMRKSLQISTGFKHGIGSNDFEIKMATFIDYQF
ncbi:DUF3800 domain-containing protein [Enterococcus dispar]|uniref:DUF3800 domain-containing protein n=1 Tax=Enterococcus dispar TaxID=44009 RepID=UPI00248FE8CA|nr:DUF3800 domain-containing protein [Enterococcus dispar]